MFKRAWQCYQTIDNVLLSNFIFNLQFLEQYLKRYNCFNFRFLNPKRGKQYLPDRPASSRPGQEKGRAGTRVVRPLAGPDRAGRPGWWPKDPAQCRPRPGTCPSRPAFGRPSWDRGRARRDGDAGDDRRWSTAEEETGKRGKRERRRGPHQGLAGVARSGRGWPPWPDSGEEELGGWRTDAHGRARFARPRASQLARFGGGGRGRCGGGAGARRSARGAPNRRRRPEASGGKEKLREEERREMGSRWLWESVGGGPGRRLDPPGEQVEHSRVRGRAAWPAAWRQCRRPRWRKEKEEIFPENPLQHLI